MYFSEWSASQSSRRDMPEYAAPALHHCMHGLPSGLLPQARRRGHADADCDNAEARILLCSCINVHCVMYQWLCTAMPCVGFMWRYAHCGWQLLCNCSWQAYADCMGDIGSGAILGRLHEYLQRPRHPGNTPAMIDSTLMAERPPMFLPWVSYTCRH